MAARACVRRRRPTCPAPTALPQRSAAGLPESQRSDGTFKLMDSPPLMELQASRPLTGLAALAPLPGWRRWRAALAPCPRLCLPRCRYSRLARLSLKRPDYWA